MTPQYPRIADGRSIDETPLNNFVGTAWIAKLWNAEHKQPILPEALAAALPGPRGLKDAIVLLSTGGGQKRAKTAEWYRQSPSLHPDGAHWLVANRVRGVGIDHFSIGDAETYQILLRVGVWILEELNFPPEALAIGGPVNFWALRLNWPGCSGAFSRPVIELL